MDSVLPIALLSVVVGAVIALVFFGSYFRKRKLEVQSIAKPEILHADHKQSKPQHQPNSKKSHSKPHSHHADKVH